MVFGEDQMWTSVVESVLTGGGAATIVAFVMRMWYKNHREQMKDMSTAIAESMKTLTEKMDSQRVHLERKIDEQSRYFGEQLKAQAVALYAQIEKHDARLQSSREALSSIEARLAVCEDRSSIAKDTTQRLQELRDTVVANNEIITARVTALYSIAKGERKLWDGAEDTENTLRKT